MSQIAHSQITLISHKLCPYVQRAVIALNEQGIKYRRIDIDLSNKPDWFKKLSPLGKVPIMVVDDDIVLFESAVIAEYINDIGGGELLSAAPVDKARQRAWIEFASATLNNIGQLYSARDECQFVEVSNRLDNKWSLLENNLAQSGFFAGEKFSLVDAAFAPVFRYFDLFEKFTEFSFLKRYSKVANWRKALNQRSSVLKAVGRDYTELLAQFVAVRNSHLGELANNYQIESATG